MTTSTAYAAGHADMMDKISAAGWAACRDEFNLINPPGTPWPQDSTPAGRDYARGEYAALCETMPRN